MSMVVERDEHIELVTPAGRFFIPVKTCSQPIMPADIKSTMDRFDPLRQDHQQGRATFVVVVNRALGPSLAEQVETGKLQGDVEILWSTRVCSGGRRARHGVHQARLHIHADVGLRAEVPLVALLGLLHLRVALAVGVLGRAGRSNQRGVHNRARAQQQAVRTQDVVDEAQHVRRNVLPLKQVAAA